MTCRNEISAMFSEKSRSDLLDYVCNRIDKNEKDIEELWNLAKLDKDLEPIIENDIRLYDKMLTVMKDLESKGE